MEPAIAKIIKALTEADDGAGFLVVYAPMNMASEMEEEVEETKPDPDDPYAVFRDAVAEGPNYGGGGGEQDVILMSNPTQI